MDPFDPMTMKNNDPPFDWKRYKSLILWMTVVFLSGSFLTLVVLLATWDTTAIPSTLNRDPFDDALPMGNFSGINISANLSTVDKAEFIYKIHFSFEPMGTFAIQKDEFRNKKNRKILKEKVDMFN
jgi:hypothetical protein